MCGGGDSELALKTGTGGETRRGKGTGNETGATCGSTIGATTAEGYGAGNLNAEILGNLWGGAWEERLSEEGGPGGSREGMGGSSTENPAGSETARWVPVTSEQFRSRWGMTGEALCCREESVTRWGMITFGVTVKSIAGRGVGDSVGVVENWTLSLTGEGASLALSS